MIGCHGGGVMVRVSWWGCHVHWENWFQVSRAGRRGEAAVPASDGKKNHLACPICRSLSSCFLVHWFIGQICQNMILLFNDYNYQMKIIQMIFSSSESLATWTRWLLTSKHMCCNIRQVSEVSKERNDTSALNILNQQRFQWNNRQVVFSSLHALLKKFCISWTN